MMDKIKYVVIRDMSAGNAEVGEMWKETKIFDPETSLHEVMLWAEGSRSNDCNHSTKNITITRAWPND